jgi:hypothetical protein
MVFTSGIEDLVVSQARSALAEDCQDIEEALERAIRLSGHKGPEDTTTDRLQSAAMEALQVEVEFVMIGPRSRQEPSRAGNQFTIHCNVGAVQTGEDAITTAPSRGVDYVLAAPEEIHGTAAAWDRPRIPSCC